MSRFRLAVAGGVTALAALAAACSNDNTLVQQSEPASFVAVGPSATPCSPQTIPPATVELHGTRINAQQRAFLVLNGYCTFFIPEYHDEQALSDGGSGYGPVAYSYAFAPTGTYADHTPFDGGYRQVASVYVSGEGPLPGPYNALHLRAGSNCVYLKHEHMGPNAEWRARIDEPASNGLCTGGTGGQLPAVSEQPSTNPDHYPAATRWVEGPGRVPLLGVRCGNEWCLIGPGSAANSAHMGQTGAGTSHKWTVRGWHDDQTLGVVSGTTMAPNGPKLSIVPTDDLETKTDASFLNTWIDVATVLVPTGTTLPAKYGAFPGYGFQVGSNVIAIRHRTTSGADVWEARVTNSAGAHVYNQSVDQEDHSSWGVKVPGTARWRWRANDEEIWVRCGVGCCMVQPET